MQQNSFKRKVQTTLRNKKNLKQPNFTPQDLEKEGLRLIAEERKKIGAKMNELEMIKMQERSMKLRGSLLKS